MKEISGVYTLKSISYKEKEELITGYIIDVSNDWTLVHYIPVDYVIDGYRLINNRLIKRYKREEEEILKEKVYLLKSQDIIYHNSNLFDIIEQIKGKSCSLIFVSSVDGNYYLGECIKITFDIIELSLISVDGKRDGVEEINISDIQSIQFGDDYSLSVNLLTLNI